MPAVIQFQSPVQSDPGVTSTRIRSLTIDLSAPLVKVVLQACDEFGEFIVDGKTILIRHEGAAATTILESPAYAAILSGLPAQLVAGGSLPEQAEVVNL